MPELWKAAFSIAGVGAVGLFVLFALYQRWLKLPLFASLGKSETYKLMLAFLALTFLAATIGLYAYTQPNNSTSQPVIIVAGVAAVAMVLAFGLHERRPLSAGDHRAKPEVGNSRAAPSKSNNVLPDATSNRIFIDHSPSQLAESISGLTRLQAQAFVANAYCGKWMRVSGRVTDVSATLNRVTVMLDNGVFASFGEDFNPSEVSHLRKGDQVAIEGRIDSVDGHGTWLEQSKILS